MSLLSAAARQESSEEIFSWKGAELLLLLRLQRQLLFLLVMLFKDLPVGLKCQKCQVPDLTGELIVCLYLNFRHPSLYILALPLVQDLQDLGCVIYTVSIIARGHNIV